MHGTCSFPTTLEEPRLDALPRLCFSRFPLVFLLAEGSKYERGAAWPSSLRKRGSSVFIGGGGGGKWELPVTLLGQEHGWVWGLHPWGVHGRGSRGNSPPQGWGFTLGEGNPPSRSGEVAEEEMATGFSCPLKESQLKPPHTFQLPRLQRKPASRTKVHFRAQKLAGN